MIHSNSLLELTNDRIENHIAHLRRELNGFYGL